MSMFGNGKRRSLLKKLRKESLRLKFLWPSSLFKWNRLTLPLSFMDDVVFKVVSAFEAVVLVLTLCFFYLCCGCSF
ncbi:unnamed protein product [Lathyrus sativus]|nr:unnamed protein product [Lathyrus sativus]